MKYFKTDLVHLFTLYWAASRVLFAHLTPVLFFSRGIFKTPSISKMECFACPVNDFNQLTVYTKHSILDAWKGSEYACSGIAPNNVLCHHNRHLMGYFEFLHCSRIICLPLNIPEKFHWQYLFEKLEEAEIHHLYFN